MLNKLFLLVLILIAPAASASSFRAALEGMTNMADVAIPPKPYDFWRERAERLVKENKPAEEMVNTYKLTLDERIAILAYSDTIYRVINKALWDRDKKILKRLQPVIDELNRGLGRLPIYSGTVYRVVGFGASVDRKRVLEENKKDAEPIYLGYTSTSKDPNWLRDNSRTDGIYLKMESKKGRWIGPLTASALNGTSQEEVLFFPYARFKVMKVNESPGKPVVIELRELE